jgi:hypothetical protein
MGTDRHAGTRIAAVVVAIVVSACGQAAPSATTSGPIATRPAPSAASVPSTPSAPPVQASGMALLGSVPGSNGDLAFWGDLAVVTHITDWDRETEDDGFIIVDIADPAKPAILGAFRCFGSFQDVSVWADLAILSQDRVLPWESCDGAGALPAGSPPFAGVRIVSIADPAAPVLVASVRTGVDPADAMQVRGSHNNTIVPDPEHDRLLVYAAVYYWPETQPHASIVEVPLKDPASARVIGTFENGTNRPCHDITVFVPGKIAACAAYEAGVILFDVSDPVRPRVISQFQVPEIVNNDESHHSTVFSADGTTLVVNAELGGEVCMGGTGSNARSLSFYDISDPAHPEHRGSFQLPRAVSGRDCYPHQSNLIPTAERDLLVTGWTGAGVEVVDFSDPTAPREVAYWMSNEGDGMSSGVGYAYWYNGRVYAANGARRGLDIFEVDAGLVPGARTLPYLNPQTEEAPPA